MAALLAAQGRRRQLREGHRFSLRGEGSVHGLVRVLTGLGGEGEGGGRRGRGGLVGTSQRWNGF